jgi:hypothetical protein
MEHLPAQLESPGQRFSPFRGSSNLPKRPVRQKFGYNFDLVVFELPAPYEG